MCGVTIKRARGKPDKPTNGILEPEKAIAKITNRNAELICHTVVAICLPPAPRPDPVSMDGPLRRTVDASFDAGLPRTGATVIARYENDLDPNKTYTRVATNLPVKTHIAEERRVVLNKQRVIELMNSPATKDHPEPIPGAESGKLRIEDLLPSVGFQNTLEADRHRRDIMADVVVRTDCGITKEEAESRLLPTPPEINRPPSFPAHQCREERL